MTSRSYGCSAKELKLILLLFFVGKSTALSPLSESPHSVARKAESWTFPNAPRSEDGTRLSTNRRSLFAHIFGVATAACISYPSPALAEADAPRRLTFQTLDSGVRVADILTGSPSGSDIVTQASKINVHITGRLLGKQGWIFMDSQAAGEDPFRLDLGTDTVITGLEQGLQGMKLGGRRRIVIPSAVGYTSRQLEPIPRDFGNRQRLYTTVMNTVRIEREQQALGADLAGVVVLDVELLRFRS